MQHVQRINGIIWINVNHSSSVTLERSVMNKGGGGGLKSILHSPNITLSFCKTAKGSQYLVSCSALVVNLSLVNDSARTNK